MDGGTLAKYIIRGVRGTYGRRAPVEEADGWEDARG